MNTIIIADDHPVTLNGISYFVSSLGYKVISTYTNGISAYNNILASKPGFAILDINMPGMTGLEILEKLKKHNTGTKVILYTMYRDTGLFEKAKSLQVNGYILKEFALEELKTCLAAVSSSSQWFSPRLTDALVYKDSLTTDERLKSLSAAERKIIDMVAQGKTSRQIAEDLFITEKTVENHRSNIIKKMGLPSGNNSLTLWALQQQFK